MIEASKMDGQERGEATPLQSYGEAFVRPGWLARFRGVQITRAPGQDGTFIVEPLPPGDGDEQWHPYVFEASQRQVRIIAPDSVRITSWARRIAEIERRPERPGDLGWDLLPAPLKASISN